MTRDVERRVDALGRRIARVRSLAQAKIAQAEAWAGETDRRRSTYDMALALRERDREAFASVLGSAIALRLFLFTTSLIVAVVAALNLVFGSWGLETLLTEGGLTSEVVTEVSAAAEAQSGRDVVALLSAMFVALLAGRSLSLVLAACSAGAWKMDARSAKASIRAIGRVAAFVALVVVAASVLQRLRDSFGLALATSSLLLNVAILGVSWFFVTLALPRNTRDPGSMLPGAALFGLLLTLVQWFMHYLLPRTVESASETMGSIGVTVASLGYLFLVGRLMAGSIVLNAVLWERFGSISDVLFRLPGLRRIPARHPEVASYFDLEPIAGDEEDSRGP